MVVVDVVAVMAAAQAAAPVQVPLCGHCGRYRLHMQTCTWCDRQICLWDGERILGRKPGDMPRWQCKKPAWEMRWMLYNLRGGRFEP